MMSGYAVKGSGNNWFVVKGAESVAGPFSKFWRADEVSDDLNRKSKMRQRPCITCGTEFISEGPHNRMCDRCRADANDMGMVA